MPETNEGQEKTEQPTGRKIQKAREEGNVPRSQDLSAALILLGGLFAMRIFGRKMIYMLGVNQTRVLENLFHLPTTPGGMVPFLRSILIEVIWILAPILTAVLVIALVANIGQVGFVFTTKPLQFNLNMFNPAQGIKRIISRRSFMRFVMSMLKAIVVGVVAYWAVKGHFGHLAVLLEKDISVIISAIGGMLFDVTVKVTLVLLILAILDWAYQRWEYKQDLRMTKEEIKEEMKQMEGDPKLRSKRRQIQMNIAMQRMMQAVPEADVVVTNPTHVAVAIQYESDTMPAPKVVAKGADRLALRIREIAALHGVPIVEKRSLARTLYQLVEVGKDVPERLFKSVAEVLAYVYQLNKMIGKRKKVAHA